MIIHINRAGSSLGQFTEQEVEDGHKNGKFLDGDLVWTLGMKEWVSLDKFRALDKTTIDAARLARESGEGAAVNGSSEEGIPWERKGDLGFWKALFETAKDVLFEPSRAFSSMKKEGGLGQSLLYYFLLMTFAGTVSTVYQAATDAILGLHRGTGEPAAVLVQAALTPVFAFLFLLIFLPLFQFVAAGLMHLSLLVVGGARTGYTTTFKTLSYSTGSTSLFYLIPFCGGFFYILWSIFATVVGLAKTNDIGYGRAVAAYVINFVFCCTICIAPWAIIIGAGVVDFDTIKAYLDSL
jgi:hypothetical protein